jgi:hypothetical protein
MARVSPKYDPQREEVYRMEKQGFPGLHRAMWSRPDIRATLRQLCKAFGVDAPHLAWAPSEKWSGLYERVIDGDWSRITLSTVGPYGRSPMTIVHEVAHHVLDRWDAESKLAPHGPEFVGIYGDALAMCGLVPYSGFRDTALHFKVQILDTRECSSPAKLRRLVKKRAAEAAPSHRVPLTTIEA